MFGRFYKSRFDAKDRCLIGRLPVTFSSSYINWNVLMIVTV